MDQDSGDVYDIYNRRLNELKRMLNDGIVSNDEFVTLKKELRSHVRSKIGLQDPDDTPKVAGKEFISHSDLEMRKILAIAEIRLSDTPEDLIALDGE